MTKSSIAVAAVAALSVASMSSASLYQITGGSASFTILEGKANSISEFDAYFDATRTRTQILGEAAPGNAPFTETAANVTLSDPVRPAGAAITTGDGRTRQSTSLQFDPTLALLPQWSNSDDAFGFTGSTTLGEQIALTGMQRYTGPFTGSLVYGDFALRYTGSKLRLTSNIDFLNAEFAEIGNPVITITSNTLTISGDLLVDQALQLLDPTAVPGTDFGDFTLTATIAPVPEPASLGLLGTMGVVLLRRRRSI